MRLLFVVSLPETVDLVGGPGEDKAENEDPGHFDSFHLRLPYKAAVQCGATCEENNT